MATQQINFGQSTFVGNDGAALFAIYAIAKYNYAYWYNYFPDNYPMSRGLFGKIWHAIKVGAWDVYGFVVDGWYGRGTQQAQPSRAHRKI